MHTTTFTQQAQEILKGLGFEVSEQGSVQVPIWRGPEDIQIPADITEEVARIRGYEKIQSLPVASPLNYAPFQGRVALLRETERFLVETAGITQVETYPRVPATPHTEHNLQLQNPVNPECPVLRVTFLPQFLEIAAKNSKFFEQFRIFDTGKVWTASPN